MEVGVTYDVDLDKAAEVISSAVAKVDIVDTKRSVEVFATEFGDSSINFMVRWWAGSTPVKAHASRDQVVRAIKRALGAAGMEIPFPQRTLWFRDALQLAPKTHEPERAREKR